MTRGNPAIDLSGFNQLSDEVGGLNIELKELCKGIVQFGKSLGEVTPMSPIDSETGAKQSGEAPSNEGGSKDQRFAEQLRRMTEALTRANTGQPKNSSDGDSNSEQSKVSVATTVDNDGGLGVKIGAGFDFLENLASLNFGSTLKNGDVSVGAEIAAKLIDTDALDISAKGGVTADEMGILPRLAFGVAFEDGTNFDIDLSDQIPDLARVFRTDKESGNFQKLKNIISGSFDSLREKTFSSVRNVVPENVRQTASIVAEKGGGFLSSIAEGGKSFFSSFQSRVDSVVEGGREVFSSVAERGSKIASSVKEAAGPLGERVADLAGRAGGFAKGVAKWIPGVSKVFELAEITTALSEGDYEKVAEAVGGAVGGTIGAVVGSVAGPVGTVGGAVAGDIGGRALVRYLLGLGNSLEDTPDPKERGGPGSVQALPGRPASDGGDGSIMKGAPVEASPPPQVQTNINITGDVSKVEVEEVTPNGRKREVGLNAALATS